jgi:hypothetical protein
MIHFKQHRLQEKTEGEAWLFFTENLSEREKHRSGLGWRKILCFSSSQPCLSPAACSLCASFSCPSSWVFLGVLGGWWRRSGELVAEGVFCRWEWVDGLVARDHGPFLYTPFSIFWGREADGGKRVFLSSLSSHSTWVVPLFSPFFAFLTFSSSLFLKLISSLSGDSN